MMQIAPLIKLNIPIQGPPIVIIMSTKCHLNIFRNIYGMFHHFPSIIWKPYASFQCPQKFRSKLFPFINFHLNIFNHIYTRTKMKGEPNWVTGRGPRAHVPVHTPPSPLQQRGLLSKLGKYCLTFKNSHELLFPKRWQRSTKLSANSQQMAVRCGDMHSQIVYILMYYYYYYYYYYY